MTVQGLPVGLGDTLSRAGGFNSGRWCWRRPLSCTRSRACPWASAAAGAGDLGPICRRTRSKGWPWGWGHVFAGWGHRLRPVVLAPARVAGAADQVHQVEGWPVGLGAPGRKLGAPAQAGGAGAGPSCRRGRSGPGQGLARGAGPWGWGRWRQGWRSRPEQQTHQVEGLAVGPGARGRELGAPAQTDGVGHLSKGQPFT
jgi:hypothetical protein